MRVVLLFRDGRVHARKAAGLIRFWRLFTGEHLTIIYTGVDKPDQVHPTAQQILACVDAASKAEIAGG